MNISLAIFILTLILTLCSPTSWAEVVGFVLLSKGGTFAVDESSQQRELTRRNPIKNGDTLITDSTGMLQIRFIDKALLTLKANSQLNIEDYQLAKAQGNEDAAVMNLLKGGFRTITGNIGKGDKNAYEVKTPAASIGIRGTYYEIAQEKSDNFVVAVWDGGVSVSNDQGQIDIGLDNDYAFARVTPDTEPQGLEKPPKILASATTPYKKQQKKNNKRDNKKPDDETQNSESESESESELQDEDQETAALAQHTEDSKANTATESAKESEFDEEAAQAEEEAYAIIDEPLQDLTQITSVDARFSDWEYTYLLNRPKAALIINQTSSTIDNALVVEDTDANTIPVFVTAGSSSGDNNVESFSIDVENGVSYVSSVAGNTYVSWGQWNDDVEYFAVSNDTSQSTTVNQNFYWLSAEAASLTTLRGTANFSGNSEFMGNIDSQPISTLSSQFDVNFNNGDISNGSMNMSDGTQSWAITYDGSVSGANAAMANIQGTVTGGSNACTSCVSGDIQGIFAKPGDQFVGGFKLDSDQSGQANGVFSLQGTKD